jgi:hypothetical protein
MSTTSQQTMFVHFFKQSTIVDYVNVVNEHINVVDEINDRDFAKRLF